MLEFLGVNTLSFFLGIIASVIASFIYEAYGSYQARKPLRSLDGYWFEFIDGVDDRSYSIGRFQYNRRTKSYTFDGSNYQNSGEIFCTWESINVYCDLKSRKIYYIFRACLKGARHAENYGFGVVNIVENEQGFPTPTSGHYIEAKDDAKPHTHSMVRLGKIISELSVSQGAQSLEFFHSQVIEKYHLKRMKVK